jgi:hypothetical protein
MPRSKGFRSHFLSGTHLPKAHRRSRKPVYIGRVDANQQVLHDTPLNPWTTPSAPSVLLARYARGCHWPYRESESAGRELHHVVVWALLVSFSLSSFPCVGVCGSRSAVPVAAVRAALSRVAPGAPVLVGCAAGVDGFVRASLPVSRLVVFGVCRSLLARVGRGAFAARSQRLVRAVSAGGGALLCFPAGPCPAGLVPSRSGSACFRGLGSGSWAAAAFAAGLGVPVLFWLPASAPAPAGWGLVPLGGRWFLRSGSF